MGRLSKRQVNLDNKTETQRKIINEYFFAKRFLRSVKFSDKHYCDLVLYKKNKNKCFEKAMRKFSLLRTDIAITDPIESLSFCYDGDYLYRNGNSSKAKYFCLFLGPKQIFAYTYTFDMTSNNFNETATEVYYNSIIAVSTDEKVCENEVDLFGFIDDLGKRSIHTLVTLKVTTSGGVFEYQFPKTPDTEKQIAEIRRKIRAFRTIRIKKNIEDLPIE